MIYRAYTIQLYRPFSLQKYCLSKIRLAYEAILFDLQIIKKIILSL